MLAACWALLLLALFVWCAYRLPPTMLSARQAVFVIGAAALAARMVPNLLLPMGAGYDIESYRIVGDLVRAGQPVYTAATAVNRHPYLPLLMYWMALAQAIAVHFDLSFVKVVRLLPIAADIGIALLLWSALRSASGASSIALRGALLYALNPVSVFVVAYHGQFDSLSLLFLLFALLALARPLTAGLWLGAAILSKSWPVLALPTLFCSVADWRGRGRLLVGALAVPLAGLVLYLAWSGEAAGTTLARALGYNHGVGVWGYSYFFRLQRDLGTSAAGLFGPVVAYGRYATLAALALVWLLWARRETAQAGVLTVLITFLACTHAFSIQYLMWLVPLAILNRERHWLIAYSIAAFGYMLLAYTTLILELHITALLPWPQADTFIIIPAGLPVWLVTVGWLWARIRRIQATNLQFTFRNVQLHQ